MRRGIDDLFALALPLRGELRPTEYPSVDKSIPCSFYSDSFTDGLVYDLSPEALTLPSNADLRFRRLVQAYRLLAGEPLGEAQGPNVITRLVEEATVKDAEYEEQTVGIALEQDKEPAAHEPRWMLWTLAECDVW